MTWIIDTIKGLRRGIGELVLVVPTSDFVQEDITSNVECFQGLEYFSLYLRTKVGNKVVLTGGGWRDEDGEMRRELWTMKEYTTVLLQAREEICPKCHCTKTVARKPFFLLGTDTEKEARMSHKQVCLIAATEKIQELSVMEEGEKDESTEA